MFQSRKLSSGEKFRSKYFEITEIFGFETNSKYIFFFFFHRNHSDPN